MKNNSRWVWWFIGAVIAAAVIIGLRAVAVMSDANVLTYRLAASGWEKLAETIVQNKIAALWHGAFMAVCAGFFIWLFCREKLRNQYVRIILQWILVLIVVVDAVLLSRRYIKTMPLKAFAENDVVRILKSAQPEKRAALLTQDGFYNHWLTFLFPYHCIQTMNVTQMPRMAADYKKFFGAVSQNPLRFWQLSAVGFVLAPAQAWVQFQNDPEMKGVFELVFAYNVKPADFSVEVVPATAEQPGQHVIMRLLKPAPRFAMNGRWEIADDDEVLRRFGSTSYPLFEKVMIAPGFAQDVPASSETVDHGQVQLLEYKPGKIKVRTSSIGPAVLRVADRYDPDWHVWVDGKKEKVLRADFIFLGVYLSPGMHEVRLEYAPSKTLFWVQASGFLIVAVAAGLLIVRRKNNCSPP